MSAAKLIERLDGVKRVTEGRWMARCPAHEDKTPSLSIRETQEGKTLIHCFGQQCPPADILAAVGLELGDLFPDGPRKHSKGEKPGHWHAQREALKALRKDALLCLIFSENVAAGSSLTMEDRALFADAVAGIEQTARAVL